MKKRVIEVPKIELANGHWVFEDFRQRMTVAEWRKVLLGEQDRIIFRGNFVNLIAKSMGFGIVEVSKKIEQKGKEKEGETLRNKSVCKNCGSPLMGKPLGCPVCPGFIFDEEETK